MFRLVFGSFVLTVKNTGVKDSKISFRRLRHGKEINIAAFNERVQEIAE
jgi:hypothetical protein